MRRAPIATRQPSRPSSIAITRPIPDEAPVTTATRWSLIVLLPKTRP
jgi:hypothetical protein